uniref:Capsid protein n=1 Tax=Exserohilum turcicum partitivirus 2 TaxID=3229044 RepID=A0AAU7YAR4_9VIRU
MATHQLINDIYNPVIPAYLAQDMLDKAQNNTHDGSAQMFKFSRFTGCTQMDVLHVITGYTVDPLISIEDKIGYRFNESFIQILNAIDPDFLLGYSPSGKSHGASSLQETTVRKLFQTFFADRKVAPPPAAINGQILSRVWTTDTDNVTQDMVLSNLRMVYYDSFHRAYHSRLPVDSLRGLSGRNSVSFANPSFLHLPLSFTEPETRDPRVTILPSDYLPDLFQLRLPYGHDRYDNTRTSHILSWNPTTRKIGAHESIAELTAFHSHSHEIISCFETTSDPIATLTELLSNVRVAIVCLDKFQLHGVSDFRSTV